MFLQPVAQTNPNIQFVSSSRRGKNGGRREEMEEARRWEENHLIALQP